MDDENLMLPEGLSKSTFTDILKKEFPNVQVKSIQATAGSKVGNNYLSQVSKITVNFTNDGEENSKSFIIKDPKKSTVDFLNVVGGIDKEMNWYKQVLPEVEKLGVSIGATCHMKHENWLLLEDLSVAGFKVQDRKAMLDLEHCLEAVKALAKFHAATHHLYKTNKIPETVSKDKQFNPNCKTTVFENFANFDKIVANLIQMGDNKYNKVIKALKPVIWDKIQQCIKENEEFLSLVHGDFWTTNIMFKYDTNKKVSDVKLIDFQLTRLGSPTYDLYYFLCSSMRPQVRENHLDEIYKVYLETLNSTLKSIGSNSSLSQEQFDKMIKGTGLMGLFTSLTFLPIPLCETSLKFEPPEDMSEEEKKNFHPFDPVYRQKTYRDQFLSLLDFFERNNVI